MRAPLAGLGGRAAVARGGTREWDARLELLCLARWRVQIIMSSQGMPVSNYKADEKEATRNRKRLMAIIKRPENQICADCPQKRASIPH